jgi:tripartite-type tricarboxylate transporter receptor subunit TctC
MLMPRFVRWTLWIGLMIGGSAGVSGQAYPNKPIRIVTAEPGGGVDLLARSIAQALSASLGQPVVVENRVPLIAIENVAKAPADGYTLLIIADTFWIIPFLQNVRYDPVRDFSPITLAATSPLVLVVHSSLPVQSVKELIALAKARPGELNYASGPNGAPQHLAGELLKTMARVNIVTVPFKGSGPAMNALIGGQVQLSFPTATLATQHVKSARLRALAVTSAEPSTLFPDLPTVAASGLPGYETRVNYAMWTPSTTPESINSQLNEEIMRLLKTTEAKERFSSMGAEALGSSRQDLSAKMKIEMARWGKVIKDAGIHSE